MLSVGSQMIGMGDCQPSNRGLDCWVSLSSDCRPQHLDLPLCLQRDRPNAVVGRAEIGSVVIGNLSLLVELSSELLDLLRNLGVTLHCQKGGVSADVRTSPRDASSPAEKQRRELIGVYRDVGIQGAIGLYRGRMPGEYIRNGGLRPSGRTS
jgi:hypothetical protein